MEDIVPGLLEVINQQFDDKTFNSKKLKYALKALQNKQATYKDANDFAIEIGKILVDVLNINITSENLPDGKMYFNIANRILNPTLQKNHELITSYVNDVQTELNHSANLRLKSQTPELNQDRIDGIINRISSEDSFEDIAWILEDPIINFSQSIVDDAIKENADFHSKVGLRPKITRTVSGHQPCEWCIDLAGTYDYNEAPKDIYRRHDRCRCTVEYSPGEGKKQNVWTKERRDPQKEEKIQVRKNLNIKKGKEK